MANETELIKERLDIAEVIGEYVQLKRAGTSFKGLCPFHQEKSPSFVVSPQKGMWHCFGCQKGGDVFSFVQEMEGIEFKEALTLLGERAGVEISARSPQSSNRRQRLFQLLSLAAKFYHEILVNQKAGEKAKKYLSERGVLDETMNEFVVGYAPNAWDTIQQWLRKKGFSPDEMIAAGLVGRSSQGKMYDRFRGRIMFPITDVQGRVVAFGGRIVPWHETGNEGKYVNSPETELYEKRRVVYNLSKAKSVLRQDTPGIVVEGYMDVVMLHQAGVLNVVGSSGTAFTGEQIGLLKRYTHRLHFAFDADAAGMSATLRATEAALASGMRVAMLVFPEGMDPADVVLQHPDALPEYIEKPQSLLSFLVDQLKASSVDSDKEAQLEALLPFVARVDNPIQQGEMVQEISSLLHVPEGRVVELVERMPKTFSQDVSSDMPDQIDEPVAGGNFEQAALGLMIEHPEARATVWPELSEKFFLDPKTQELYNSMHSLAESRQDFLALPGDTLVELLPEHLRSFAEGVRVRAQQSQGDLTGVSVGKESLIYLRLLRRRYLEDHLEDLQSRLMDSDQEERAGALQQFQAVAEELAEVKSQE